MGTTLENGVYLPSEGERNCYAGLKTNWEILDQKVADVTALQQAVAGALHREIVESLPTTDIDPNTIYMILSGTSATENVYNEYMYVNNAWELIGTSATDLTNYYTKAEVDGKLLLKANASDLTSHTGDTTIHVTTADKNKWNNQTYVFRYSSTALVASSTNSNALLDNTDNLKVGDKVIDSSGVLFSITAIDTQNSTFTIGTALIDLAQDSDVVHKSGNETISGNKLFSVTPYIYNSDSTANEPSIIFRNSKYAKGDITNTGEQRVIFTDSNNTYVGQISSNKNITGTQFLAFTIYSTDNNNANLSSTINYYLSKNGDRYFTPYEDSLISLGGTGRRWKSVYATNYYYGSNNVEFSQKFVTTDTAQTITGVKTFTGNISLKSLTAEYTVTGSGISVTYSDKNGLLLAQNKLGNYQNGISYNKFSIFAYDSNNQLIDRTLTYSSSNNALTTTYFRSDNDSIASLGTTGNRWSKVYAINYYYGNDNIEFSTKFVTTDTDQTVSGNKTFSSINGVEPSSLSLPSDRSARIDISSYFINTGTGNTNNYSVPANGYIYMEINDCISLYMYSQTTGGLTNYGNSVSRNTIGKVVGFLPVRNGDVFTSQWYTTATNVTVTNAFFIPCQGNV